MQLPKLSKQFRLGTAESAVEFGSITQEAGVLFSRSLRSTGITTFGNREPL